MSTQAPPMEEIIVYVSEQYSEGISDIKPDLGLFLSEKEAEIAGRGYGYENGVGQVRKTTVIRHRNGDSFYYTSGNTQVDVYQTAREGLVARILKGLNQYEKDLLGPIN